MANSSGHMSHHGARGTVWTLVAPNELARLASLQPVATRRLPRVQVGCTPITPRVLTRSVFAVPAAAPLCAQIAAALREAVCAAQRTAPARQLEGADPAPRWTLKRLVLVCARALRPPLLSRDDPNCSAPPQAV